ncbi:hypothetical protein EDF62_0366 [Leucobacter luti]|uniref:Uncharacterized protein n=1 Tax=Leucobacter luti TaxID=340320 RepID=A0A4R6S761_9MICO|nr:hypothetical protein EDF62_0366 [Leucobacter luti]
MRSSLAATGTLPLTPPTSELSRGRHATSRHVTSRHGTARHGTARHATPRHATPRHATPRGRSHHSPAQHPSAQGRERRESQRQGAGRRAPGAGRRAPGAGSLSESGQTRGERYWASTLVPLPDHPTPLSGPDGPDGPARPDAPAKSDGAAELRTRAPPDRWSRPSDLNRLANQPAIVAKPVRQTASQTVSQSVSHSLTQSATSPSELSRHGGETGPNQASRIHLFQRMVQTPRPIPTVSVAESGYAPAKNAPVARARP